MIGRLLRRGRGRRLLAGGALGGAILVARRRRGRLPTSGLRAFEDAPCFREDAGAAAHPHPPERD